MKLLRNPVAVGVLALVAVILVFMKLLPVIGKSWHRKPAVQSAKAPTPKPTPPLEPVANQSPGSSTLKPSGWPDPGLAKSSTGGAPEPALGLDMPAAERNSSHWVLAPRRDPFHGREELQSRARQVLKLKAIWRHAGGALAVVNDRTLGEGDNILEFSVDKIERDRVWVVGPNGREDLIFKLPTMLPRLALESP